MSYKNPANVLALILVIVGALNWGLVGALDYNLVDEIFGVGSAASELIYVAVGVAGLYLVVATLVFGAKATDHQRI